MKILFIILIVYMAIVLVLFGLQALISSFDGDQSYIPWKMIIKQSFKWPGLLIKLFIK